MSTLASTLPTPTLITPDGAVGFGEFPNTGIDPDDTNLQDILDGLELEKVVEGRNIRIALGSIGAAAAIYVIYKIWHDSWRASQFNVRPNAK